MASAPKSYFKQTVCLADWWLIKAENDFQGSRLAVAGQTSRENKAMRVFSSAPILKRYDVFTVETADGICVILKGFLNKKLTEVNGFPSDVFSHFVYGFPPYWKELEENIMGKESFNLLRSLSPQSETECGVDNCKKDLGSQDLHRDIDVRGKRKSKNNESYPRNLNVEDYTILNGHVDLGNTGMELLSNSRIGRNIGVLDFTDAGVDYSGGDASEGILLACQLRNRSADDLREMESDKNNCKKAKLDKIMNNTPQKSLTHSEGRVITRSMGRLRMKSHNEEISGSKILGPVMRSNPVSSVGPETLTDVCGPEEGRGSEDFKVFEFVGDEIKSSNTEISRSRKGDNNLRKVKTEDNINKAKSKISKGTPVAASNQEDSIIPQVNTSSGEAKSLDMKPRRKLEYETPNREKDKVCASPQNTSFGRSRSGRLLMPTLEFWRNQRAVYDADGTLTGIEGVLPDQQEKGSSSPSPRKKRKPNRRV